MSLSTERQPASSCSSVQSLLRSKRLSGLFTGSACRGLFARAAAKIADMLERCSQDQSRGCNSIPPLAAEAGHTRTENESTQSATSVALGAPTDRPTRAERKRATNGLSRTGGCGSKFVQLQNDLWQHKMLQLYQNLNPGQDTREQTTKQTTTQTRRHTHEGTHQRKTKQPTSHTRDATPPLICCMLSELCVCAVRFGSVQ